MIRSGAPFLRKLSFRHDAQASGYPWTIPLFRKSFEWTFTKSVTVVVGENGSGKSTLLEAIAAHCGFGAHGGGRNQINIGESDVAPVLTAMRFAWFPRIGNGFFFRAESFFDFANYIDELGPAATGAYGGMSLNQQSHGEAFLALFDNRFGARGIYILDEPEAALSPARQLALLDIIHRLSARNECQIIMATHSPILMSYERAELMYLEDDGCLSEKSFRATPHWQLYARFMADPARYQPKDEGTP